MRILGGFFIVMDKYTKPPLFLSQQVDLLKSRGLVVKSQSKAEVFLGQVNYYRFSAYCLPFEISRHELKKGVTFEEVRELYEFDRRLRFLIDEALELIEIAIRSAVAYHLSHKYGPFVHEDSSKFYTGFNHAIWISKVHDETERSTETFITHYRNKYDGFPAIPIWMVVETMSFGGLSKLIHNLLRADQIEISKKFRLHSAVLTSWLHTFTYIRNICAHHSRLWNRELAITMILPRAKFWDEVHPKRVISVVLAINYLISQLSPGDHIRDLWRKEIEELFNSKINVSNFLEAMGIKSDLKSHALWKT
jgi:abortive infection bacteriophage resistance protein